MLDSSTVDGITLNFKLSLNRIEFKIIEDQKHIKGDEFKIEDFNKVTEIKDSILNYIGLLSCLNQQ